MAARREREPWETGFTAVGAAGLGGPGCLPREPRQAGWPWLAKGWCGRPGLRNVGAIWVRPVPGSRGGQVVLELCRDLGERGAQGRALIDLGTVQRLTGDYPAATSSQQQALELFRDLGDRYGQILALIGLGTVQRLRSDYPAAATSQQRALELSRDLGVRDGQGLGTQRTRPHPATDLRLPIRRRQPPAGPPAIPRD